MLRHHLLHREREREIGNPHSIVSLKAKVGSSNRLQSVADLGEMPSPVTICLNIRFIGCPLENPVLIGGRHTGPHRFCSRFCPPAWFPGPPEFAAIVFCSHGSFTSMDIQVVEASGPSCLAIIVVQVGTTLVFATCPPHCS